MKEDELLELMQKNRGRIIELFSRLEHRIDKIISYHFFKRQNNDFIWTLLSNDQCSFALKRNVFEIIYCFHMKEKPNNDTIQGLNRLNKIRNHFAHCATMICYDGTTNQPLDVVLSSLDFKRKGNIFYLEVNELVDEFDKQYSVLNESIDKLQGKMGFKDKV